MGSTGIRPTPGPSKGGEPELAGDDEQCMINKLGLVNENVRQVYLHFTPLPLRGGAGGEASFSPPLGGAGGGLHLPHFGRVRVGVRVGF